MRREADIHCPECAWRPKATDRWVCFPGCGTEWNTFWTRALCPGCAHQWVDTQCLRCGKVSPHESWYHYPEGESVDDAELRTREVEST